MSDAVQKFYRHDRVVKPNGYAYPGTVVAAFQNLTGAWRYVVESTRTPGMLHIFSGVQLELDPIDQPCPRCEHEWSRHEKHVDNWFCGVEAYVCLANMGMGDPCGCDEKIPQIVHDTTETK